MSNKSRRKAERKAAMAEVEMQKRMAEHPEWCYCEELLHKEADIDIDNPIGTTEPIDGFPRWNSTGFTQNIYKCRRCGKQYIVPIVFASTPASHPNEEELQKLSEFLRSERGRQAIIRAQEEAERTCKIIEESFRVDPDLLKIPFDI